MNSIFPLEETSREFAVLKDFSISDALLIIIQYTGLVLFS
jgi:hypothetical protein